MLSPSEKAAILTTHVRIRPELKADFLKWQAKLHGAIAAFPGFSSLEISSIGDQAESCWLIIQRFQNSEGAAAWQKSEQRMTLVNGMRNYLASEKPECFQDVPGISEGSLNGITEVFVTQVSPDKEEAYRQWIAKLHQAEANCPGFQRVYVQAPTKGQGINWITFLQFDTQENLDRWLGSEERHKIMQEAEPLIKSLESHRMISPYAGWFANVMSGSEPPAVWKQTMLVLLVLFPIIMVELKYLSPLTAALNPSLATFIGNAISVTLISYPMMPIALLFLGWWLKPKKEKRVAYTLLGTGILILLYLLEIAVFWNLL